MAIIRLNKTHLDKELCLNMFILKLILVERKPFFNVYGKTGENLFDHAES